MEINQLNDVVTELKIKQNKEKTENEMLRRRIEQLQKSSKVLLKMIDCLKHVYVRKLCELASYVGTPCFLFI